MVKLVENFGAKVALGWSRALLLSFIFGFVIRLVPEVLSLYPIGFDPIWYAWRIRSGVVWYHWSQVFSTWLLYGILIPFYNATQVNLFGLLKLTAALLFGFNACGVYYFATKALSWTVKKGLLASVFFSLQTAALFLSSNLYRNMLGLGILLFTLPLIKDDLKSTKQFMVFALLSMLVVLGHELASIILFAVVLGFLVARFLRREKTNTSKRLIAVIPAFSLFMASFYFMVFPMSYQIEKNVISVYEPSGNYQGPLFFFKNYLAVYETNQFFPAYLDLSSRVLSFFAVLYLLILPLVLVGFFRDGVLDSWTAVLLIGSFGILVMPVFAPSIWSRCLLLLVYPFTFYAVNGIAKVSQLSRSVDSAFGRARWTKLSKRAVTLIFILLVACGLVYSATTIPAQVSVVPLRDFDDTVKAMQWLNSKMDDGSALLAHFAFSWWSRLYLESHTRIYFKDDIERALNLAMQRGFNDIYFVWWNEKIGWFTLTVPSGFVSVFDSGRVSVFKYSV